MKPIVRFYTSKLRSKPELILSILFVIIFSFLIIAPFIQMIYTSLTYQDYDLRLQRGAVEGAFTLFHYIRIFASDLTSALLIKPLIHSLAIGFGVTILAMIIGSIFAWIFVRTDISHKKFFQTVITIPYMIPSWVIALVWQLFFQNNRIGGTAGILQSTFGISIPDWLSYGYVPIVITLALHYYAYTFLMISGALRTIDSELEEAGAVAGLSRMKVLTKITFPLVLPALGSSFVLTFTRSMGTFGTPALLGLPVRYFTLPTQIYALINSRNTGDAFVLALVLIVLAITAISINNKIIGVRRSFVTMKGKGFRANPMPLGKLRPVIMGLLILFLMLVIVFPIIMLILSTFILLPDNYSFSNMTTHFWVGESEPLIASGQKGVLRNPGILNALYNSIRLGIIAAVTNAFLGLLIGYTVVKNRGTKIAKIIESVAFAPYVFPGIAFAAIYLSMFSRSIGPIPALYGTFALIVLIVVVKNLPFSSRSGISAIMQIDQSLEESAVIQGIPWLRRFRLIILPLSKSGFISGMLLTFITSMRELSLVILLVTPKTGLLTTMIFAYKTQEQTQHVNAVTLLLLIVIIIANILIKLISMRSPYKTIDLG
ncbi:MAG: iron ABC transporter permease [Sphaerochaetaceae bacterium]|nr:iron ABC transporter permease [Sphaerochaetaceae bacterium]